MFPFRYFAPRYFTTRYYVSNVGFKLNITTFSQQTIGILTITSTYATLVVTRTDT